MIDWEAVEAQAARDQARGSRSYRWSMAGLAAATTLAIVAALLLPNPRPLALVGPILMLGATAVGGWLGWRR